MMLQFFTELFYTCPEFGLFLFFGAESGPLAFLSALWDKHQLNQLTRNAVDCVNRSINHCQSKKV